ncbi:MAG: lipoprotein, partial [Erysipelotrichaceae bacterium]|nr:lipoprotein [Erysipelotrichaceae bacterium]
MKKILILISLLLALSGCLSKKIAWEDVSARYDEIYNEAISEAAAYDSYSISDFKNLFAAVCEKVEAIKEGVKEEDEEALHS